MNVDPVRSIVERLEAGQSVRITEVNSALVAAGERPVDLRSSPTELLADMAEATGLSVGELIDFIHGAGRRLPVPRNEPCPCGSGLKFKRCHGA